MNLFLLKKNGESYALFKEGNEEVKRLVESGEGIVDEVGPLRWIDGWTFKYRSTIYLAKRSMYSIYCYSYREFFHPEDVYTDCYKGKYDAEHDWWKLQPWK